MQNLQTKYYNFLTRLFRFETKIKQYPVDFTKPWYVVFGNEKWRLSLVLFIEIINAIFDGIFPLIVVWVIESKLYNNFLWLIFAYFAMETLHRVATYYWHIAIGNLQASILLAIQIYFLTVDPIKHSTKSSGQIISKIQSAGGQSFMVMLLTILFEILPTVITYLTVVFLLLKYDLKIGLVAVGFFVVITIVSSFLRHFHSISLNKPWIKARDKYVANQVENLQQNTMIRSTFATPEQIIHSQHIINQTMSVRNVRNQGNSINTYFMRILYTLSMMIIGFLLFDLINQNLISPLIATTLMIIYYNGSKPILKIGDMVAQVTESNADLVDLYSFINNFGKQTFPVLDNNTKPHN